VIACDAVLFDMDGTLVDSRQIVERMWLRWAREHGLAPEAVLAEAHGRRTLETMQRVAPDIAKALEEGGETAIAGAAGLLRVLPADRWAVVTSAIRRIAAARLAGAGLPLPRVLVGAEDVPAGKPAPDGYLKAARALGVEPARCVVIEDTPAGVQAGRAAGAVVIGLCTTFAAIDGCDVVLADLRGIRLSGSAGPGALRLEVEAR
jgi:sugar-phosphatase